jgi:hypothetical protein
MGRPKKSIAELKKSGSYRPSRHGRPVRKVAQECASQLAQSLPEGLSDAERHICRELLGCLPPGSLEPSDRFAFASLVRLIAKERHNPGGFMSGDMSNLIRLYQRFAMTPFDRRAAGEAYS